MANRWKGNIVAAAATTSSGTDYTGKANGAWGLNSQLQQKQGGLWAKGQTVPAAPTSVTATIGNAQSIVSFTAPTDNGGSTITGYTVTSSTGGITATGSASPITITGLTNGTAYTFTVTAINGIGTGTASSPSNSVTPTATSIPNAPTITSVSISGTTATINFTAPSFDGYSPITSYTAISSVGQTGTVYQSGSGSVSVSGLPTFTNITFTLQATNAIGNSLPSNTSSSVTYPVIGDSYGGGFYAGKISTTGNGVATHALVVAPKATGFASKKWGPLGVTTGIVSQINGPANSASLAALGSAYEGATFCEGLSIGGYNDWYLPAKLEVEVIFWYLRTGQGSNDANFNGVTGKNPYAVSPEPVNTAYVWSQPVFGVNNSPTAFKSGGSEAYDDDFTLTSTEATADKYQAIYMYSPWWHEDSKFATARPTRAVRRVAL